MVRLKMQFSQIKILFLHEWRKDLRNKSSLFATLMYAISAIYVCFLSFGAKQNNVNILVWNSFYWIISLFSCINAMGRNMNNESENQQPYLYQIVSPQVYIISKIAYNTVFLITLTTITFIFQSFILGNKIENNLLYLFSICIAMIGFSASLTLIGSIASKTKNNATIMAVLSFPTLIPVLLLALKLCKNAIDGLELTSSSDEIITIISIDVISISISFLLFPFLWKN